MLRVSACIYPKDGLYHKIILFILYIGSAIYFYLNLIGRKSKKKEEISRHANEANQSRINELNEKVSKGSKKEIRISFDSFTKSDAKAFGQLLIKSRNRTVIQLWTDKFKIGKFLKGKILKATKEHETPIKPDEKSMNNSLSCDVNENIFVIKGKFI